MTRASNALVALVFVAGTAHAGGKAAAGDKSAGGENQANVEDQLAKYMSQLEAMKLIDVESGTLETLRKELQIGESLLRSGAYSNAAVTFYAIVKSPRYTAFTDFVEYQNAEYDLAVSLGRTGAYGAALDILDVILARGPAAQYWGPAHRRAVDIAIETRDHAGILARIEAIKTTDTIPVSAAGERAYLRGRAAYDANKLADAEGELVQISKKSRLYSSAVYLRGVIRARRQQYKDAADAMCEIAATPDDDKFTFVVDDRYFTVKDLARLGLGRLAHEQGEYDDAYYHYFQIPEDSMYLPDALFEASWSMYQKRELATSRDLVHEFLKTFPTSPLWPEASLLAGYVELADCKFDESKTWYDQIQLRLEPIVKQIGLIKKDPDLRDQLFDKALTRFREIKTEVKPQAAAEQAKTPLEEVTGLLRLDPKFIRLNEAIIGARELANSAPQVVRQWQNLGAQVAETHVGKVATEQSLEEEQLADANAVVEELRRLGTQISEQRSEIARGKREGLLAPAEANAELERLDKLFERNQLAEINAVALAEKAAKEVSAQAAPSLRPLLQEDLADARRLDKAAHALAAKLDEAGQRLSQTMVDRLYSDTRRVLDKAKLGKIDAVIGQKRKLDIEVQDLASGRFPEELIGRLWNASMIGDDEEYWPFQGEYWHDEYEGYR